MNTEDEPRGGGIGWRWRGGRKEEYIVSIHQIAFFVFWVVIEEKVVSGHLLGFNIIR